MEKKRMGRKPPAREQAAREQAALPATTIYLLMVDGEPVTAFETEREMKKERPETIQGGVVEEVPFTWDAEVARQRRDEWIGLLGLRAQYNLIVGYLRQTDPELFEGSGSARIADIVVRLLERRWRRRVKRVLEYLSWFGRRGKE